MPRPALPAKHFNPFLKKFSGTNIPPVKYQILSCQGKEILVGRLKIEVPDGGHAFILRRFDTNALSITTMFRAAFPTSSEAEEKAEIAWVKETHDLSGNNGSSREPTLTRLAGTWVGPQLALELADSYGLTSLVQAMVDAKPDPNGNYRRSHKATAAANTPQAAANANADGPDTPRAKANATPQKPPSKALPTPSPTTAPAAKRRKESSPAPAAAAPVAAPSTPSQSKVPLPRRSARTKSPAPSKVPVPLTSVTSTTSSKPRSRSSVAPPSPKKKELELHPKSSQAKGDDDEDALVEDGVAGSELYEQDISEQKKLIADLKKKRAIAATASTSKSSQQEDRDDEMDEEEEEEEEEESEGPSKLKRARPDEEEPLKFQFKEPETEQRQIATNRRVGRFNMEPRTKSIAWGLAAFAVGMGAVSFLPNLF